MNSASLPGSDQSSLVTDISNISSGEAGGEGGHLLGQLLLVELSFQSSQVNFEDAGPPLDIWSRHVNLSVKPARPHQGLVQDVDPVGGGEDDHVALAGVEAVHLHEELVESVLGLALTTQVPPAPLPAHGVDLVNEEDAGRVLPGHGEHVSDPGGPNSNKHLQELGAGHRDEGHVRLARGGLGEQSFPGARGSGEDRALRDLGSQVSVLAGVLQEIDKLHDFYFGLFTAGYVFEGHIDVGRIDDLSCGLSHPTEHGSWLP